MVNDTHPIMCLKWRMALYTVLTVSVKGALVTLYLVKSTVEEGVRSRYCADSSTV